MSMDNPVETIIAHEMTNIRVMLFPCFIMALIISPIIACKNLYKKNVEIRKHRYAIGILYWNGICYTCIYLLLI